MKDCDRTWKDGTKLLWLQRRMAAQEAARAWDATSQWGCDDASMQRVWVRKSDKVATTTQLEVISDLVDGARKTDLHAGTAPGKAVELHDDALERLEKQ